jgi:hypothetical protein
VIGAGRQATGVRADRAGTHAETLRATQGVLAGWIGYGC